jgi:hypothetical protein
VSNKGTHRKPASETAALMRRSFLAGGGTLAAGALFGISKLDPPPEETAVRQSQAWSADAARARSTPAKASRSARRARPPRIHTTKEWDARSPESKPTILRRPPKYLVVHHTFSDNLADFSRDQGFRLSRSIQNAHMGQGWGDTGQHFTISRGGHVMEGRAGSLAAALKGGMVVGTHVRGANDYTVGIECEGTYNTVLPPRQLLASLIRMLAWLCTHYDLNPRTAIVPHMKFNDTDCCGYRWAPTLPRLRFEVGKLV